ncbi:hypothetical protein SKAU_G00210000 [Synaphobranchus kaupii]|uniref:Uncharacterized protein n=1 Tax=Synaphobranchus kaupii TaxID=118154 RepID=A0A9Q1IUY4_SYNKA|nr:hypothetical protein SKAU_G00210000 [Synaphobranchus kaupii]
MFCCYCGKQFDVLPSFCSACGKALEILKATKQEERNRPTAGLQLVVKQRGRRKERSWILDVTSIVLPLQTHCRLMTWPRIEHATIGPSLHS